MTLTLIPNLTLTLTSTPTPTLTLPSHPPPTPASAGVIDASKFMSHMKAASDAYYLKHPEIPNGERVIFEEITDNIGIVGSAKAVESDSMNRS